MWCVDPTTGWPIATFAPVHPTGRVSLSSDAATLRLARTTIWATNSATHWAPINGLCLAWPSASRLADKHEPFPFGSAALLDHFETALRAKMQANFWPNLGGGGLEQVGATVAVNELLLQSFEGFLRFFPGWALGEAARFATLRAYGAMLVSASVDADGVASDIVVVSEQGADCVFQNPWLRLPPNTPVLASRPPAVVVVVRECGSGSRVAVEADPGSGGGVVEGRLRFKTSKDGCYTIAR